MSKSRKQFNSCFIPEKWGQRIYEMLSYFRPSMNYKKIQFNICEFEKCQLCYDEKGWCDLGVNCTDNFKYIENISRHFQGVRTMIRYYTNLKKRKENFIHNLINILYRLEDYTK